MIMTVMTLPNLSGVPDSLVPWLWMNHLQLCGFGSKWKTWTHETWCLITEEDLVVHVPLFSFNTWWQVVLFQIEFQAWLCKFAECPLFALNLKMPAAHFHIIKDIDHRLWLYFTAFSRVRFFNIMSFFAIRRQAQKINMFAMFVIDRLCFLCFAKCLVSKRIK